MSSADPERTTARPRVRGVTEPAEGRFHVGLLEGPNGPKIDQCQREVPPCWGR